MNTSSNIRSPYQLVTDSESCQTLAVSTPWGEPFFIRYDPVASEGPIFVSNGEDAEEDDDYEAIYGCTADADAHEHGLIGYVIESQGPDVYVDPSQDLSIEEALVAAVAGCSSREL